jgi:hypothetical protein
MVATRNFLSYHTSCAWCSSLEILGEFLMVILVNEFSKYILFQQYRIIAFCDFLDLILHNGVNIPQLHVTFAELAGKIQDAVSQLRRPLFPLCHLNWNVDMICLVSGNVCLSTCSDVTYIIPVLSPYITK